MCNVSFKNPYTKGHMAPPAMPIIIMAEPVFVNLPNPLIPRGKIAGHINEFAIPSKATKIKDVVPVVNTDTAEKRIPTIVHMRKANCRDTNLGIVIILIIYPINMQDKENA